MDCYPKRIMTMTFIDKYYKMPRPDLTIDANLSQKLRVLSYVGAFCVVCLHFGRFIDTSTWVNAFVSDAIIRGCFFASVSMFFMFSGMLLVKDFDGSATWWRRSVAKRVTSLLVPYLFWCVSYGVYFLLHGHAECYSSVGFWLQCLGISPHHVLPIYCQMWYVRNLFLLCIISPLLILAVNFIFKYRATQIVFAIVFLVASVLDFPLKDQTVMATLYFMVGIYLGFNSRWLKKKTPIVVCCGFAALLVVRGVGRHLWGMPSPYLHWVVFAFAIAWVWRFYDFIVSFKVVDGLMKKKWMVDLQNTSFFLYCLHMWIFLQCPQWPKCMDGWVVQPIFQSFVIMAATYAIYVPMRKYLPWLCRLTTGGR